jgi:hypothetical protein
MHVFGSLPHGQRLIRFSPGDRMNTNPLGGHPSKYWLSRCWLTCVLKIEGTGVLTSLGRWLWNLVCIVWSGNLLLNRGEIYHMGLWPYIFAEIGTLTLVKPETFRVKLMKVCKFLQIFANFCKFIGPYGISLRDTTIVRTFMWYELPDTKSPDPKPTSNSDLPVAWITGPATDPSLKQSKKETSIWKTVSGPF